MKMKTNVLIIPPNSFASGWASSIIIRSLHGTGEYFVHGGTKDFSKQEFSKNEKQGIQVVLQRILEKIQESS